MVEVATVVVDHQTETEEGVEEEVQGVCANGICTW